MAFKHKVLFNLSAVTPLHPLCGQVPLSHEELDPFISANCYKDETDHRWICSLCGQSTVSRVDMARHTETEAKHVILPQLVCHMPANL